MQMRVYRLFVCCSMLALLPLDGLAQSAARLASVVGRHFEIVGTDQRSVSCANTLGTRVANLCKRYLGAGKHTDSQSIFVALRPDAHAEFEGHYRVRIGERGGVTLDFRWDESLSLETACHAFAEAYIARYAYFNYGPQAPARVRFWAVSAFGTQSYLSLRTAQKIHYLQDARASGFPALAPLLDLDVASAAHSQVSPRLGYWLWLALRESGLRRSAIGDLFDQAIAGMNVADQLQTSIAVDPKEQSTIGLETWWRSQTDRLLARDYDQCERMEVSRDWIAELADFDRYRAAGRHFENLRSLWTHRNDEVLRAVLSARCQIIRLRLERVNPAYFNAARSLGALYETTLKAERKYEFMHALAAYLSDTQDTRRLHELTHDLLDAE
jgi:hypothetical protein